MSETNGSVVDTGNPAANAGATNTGTTDTAAADAKWYSGFEDAELRGFVEKKGWGSPSDTVKSYRELEKHVGAPADRILKLPEDPNSPDWAPIRQRLGFAAPEKPEDYELEKGLPQGADPAFAQNAAKWAHELGIPKDKMVGLAEKWNAYINESETSYANSLKQSGEAELAELRGTWGAQFNPSSELARRAANEVMTTTGMTEADLNQIEASVGTAKFLKMFAAVGSKNHAEAQFHGAEGAGSGARGFMSPDVAKAELARLLEDPVFGKAAYDEMQQGLMGPAQRKIQELNKIANPS